MSSAETIRSMTTLANSSLNWRLKRCLVDCRWWFQGQVSTLFSTTTLSGTPDAPQGDQPAPRATNRTLNRLAALPRYVHFHKFDLKQTQPTSFNSDSYWLLSLLRWSSSGVSIVTWSVLVTWQAIVTFTSSRRALNPCGRSVVGLWIKIFVLFSNERTVSKLKPLFWSGWCQ